ncbi:MAG TPA: hypothetical protein VMG12_39275, partial [Polyangiaceae bacterium]|nr:hypothetical protein [Polyangiaceae bacterium]
ASTALALLLAAGCGGNDQTAVAPAGAAGQGAPPANEGAPPSTNDPSTDTPDAPPGPLYVGATRVFSPDSSQGYLFAVPSLGSDGVVDLRRSVEIQDAWVFGNPGPDFFTATIFEPTIVSWHVTAEGNFVKGPTLSFANQGVAGTYTAASTPLYSADKSYFVDSGSLQVVVWTPREMVFLRTIELPEPPMPGFEPTAELTIRDGQVLVSMMWTSQDSGFTKNGDFVRLVAIDPVTDTVSDVTDDTRCASLSPAGVTSDGTAYFSPWDYHAAVRGVFGAGFGSASCGLRVIPSASALDQGYDIDLSALVGGRPAGGLQLLDDQEALLHVWHEELVAATPETWSDQRFEPGYKWYRWRLGTNEATELPDQEPSAEGSGWRRLDGKTISFANNAEYTETTLLELDDSGHGQPGLSVPGWIVTMLRAY